MVFCSPGCLCVLGFCVFGAVFGVLGGCFWGCFLFFGVCRGFCFVGVVVFGVVFLFGRCGSIVCFVFWCVVWVGVLFLSVWVAGVYLCWWASAGGECFFWGCVLVAVSGLLGCFLWCAGFGLPLLCLLYVFLYVFLLGV